MKNLLSATGFESPILLKILKPAGFLIVLLMLTSALQAQNRNTRFWLDAGLGFTAAGGGPETEPGGSMSLRAAGHFQIEKVVLSLPVTVNSGGESSYESFFGGNMRDEFVDVGLLVGYAMGHNSDMQLTISTGISRVSGSRVYEDTEECWFFCNGGKREGFNAVVGIPVEVGFYTLGSSAFGLGFAMHLNFNAEETFAGFSLNLMIGDRD
ncbi:MAG: hypothetical protein R3222_06135 [Balneolaceae bacterium]|nr:hypothetical protein [Balneolaceae bacterium]